ncbi:hypothetical protein GCM10023232_27160 [Sphingosinicella ginsenosidimutans]
MSLPQHRQRKHGHTGEQRRRIKRVALTHRRGAETRRTRLDGDRLKDVPLPDRRLREYGGGAVEIVGGEAVRLR